MLNLFGEATPCNDFYNHSKTTLNGTVSDVEKHGYLMDIIIMLI